MSIASYHLVKIPLWMAVKGLLFKKIKPNTKGLIYVEYMTSMVLGESIFSPSRYLITEIAIFAQWEDEKDLESFLKEDTFGKVLKNGWHIRLGFIRNWGKINGFKIPQEKERVADSKTPVVAVTIARMKPFAIPRFLHWGKPVEKLVRDHSGTLLSLASFKFPNTISTFTIWKNAKEMTNMVHGHSNMSTPKRHANAMKERERKNFHFEFATLRFRPISEVGSWKGKENYIQNNE